MSELEQPKSNKKKQTGDIVKFVVILVLVAGVILAIYLRMTNQSKNSAKQAEENMTETQTLKMYDMEAQYPKTARDVVKMHCRLLKCMYNEDLSDDEYQQLNGQARQLFSAELLESNPESTQLSDLMKDVEEFQSAGKIYISYTVDSEDNVMYSTVDSKEYAMVLVTCNIKESTVTNAIEEEYLLCKEDGNWKIVGWEGLQTDDTSETED